VAFERQVVRAALSGDRQQALHAFLLDPNMQARLELEQIGQLLDEMLEANERWLPLFGRERV
jgi:alpha-galactosidase